jgi:hypothetical protein
VAGFFEEERAAGHLEVGGEAVDEETGFHRDGIVFCPRDDEQGNVDAAKEELAVVVRLDVTEDELFVGEAVVKATKASIVDFAELTEALLDEGRAARPILAIPVVGLLPDAHHAVREVAGARAAIFGLGALVMGPADGLVLDHVHEAFIAAAEELGASPGVVDGHG